MIRSTWHAAVLTVLLITLMTGAGLAAQDDPSGYWQAWDVRIDRVDPAANTFYVSERYDLTFDGTFRRGTRIVELTRLDSIDRVRVTDDGREMRASCDESPGSVCVEQITEGLRIRYYFFEPVNGSARRHFVIEYRVVGAMRVYEGGDQVWWSAIPADHPFPVLSSTITVQLPEALAPREGVDPIESYGVGTLISVNGALATFMATSEVAPNETIDIRVQFPHSENARMAAWQPGYDAEQQTIADRRANAAPLTRLLLFGAVVFGLGVPAGIFLLTRANVRTPIVPDTLSEPPDDVPPAIAGALVAGTGKREHITGMMVDLARRGYITMHNSGGVLYSLERTQKADDLYPFEGEFLDALFMGSLAVDLTTMGQTYHSRFARTVSKLNTLLITNKLIHVGRKRAKLGLTLIGGLVLLIGVFSVVLLPDFIEQNGLPAITLAVVPLTLIVIGLGMVFSGGTMSIYTQRGTDQRAKWSAFREYLRKLNRMRANGIPADQWDRYLGYATAFGVEKGFIEATEERQDIRTPHWYVYDLSSRADDPHGAQDAARGLNSISDGLTSGLNAFTSGLNSMLNETASALFPPSSGDSSGSWDSGGSSFSGGGDSGGSSGGGSSSFD